MKGMGAHAYWYYVPFETVYNAALDKLREGEFKAGIYNPIILFPAFPITAISAHPGPQHTSVFEPLEETKGDGTGSILDVLSVSGNDDYCMARILKGDELKKYFETEMPGKEVIESNPNFYEDIERGKAFCITVYKDDTPDELFFAGYSFGSSVN